jgi:hypothetical protein
MNTGAIFFEELPEQVKAKAYELVAYQLFEDWCNSEDEDYQIEVFMEALGQEKGMEHYAQAYELAKELGDE